MKLFNALMALFSGSHYIFLRTWHQKLTTETECPLNVSPPLFKSTELTMFSYERGFCEFRHFSTVFVGRNKYGCFIIHPLIKVSQPSNHLCILLSQLSNPSSPPPPTKPTHPVKSVKKCNLKTLMLIENTNISTFQLILFCFWTVSSTTLITQLFGNFRWRADHYNQ